MHQAWASFMLLLTSAAACTRVVGPNSPCNTQTRPGTTKFYRPDAVRGWHPRKIRHDEFCLVKALQPGRLHVVKHTDFELPVVVKMAMDADADADAGADAGADAKKDMDHEVSIYHALDGTGITPAFLGHVTGHSGQAIGFIMEYIDPSAVARTRERESGKGCVQALASLHQHGISHGDAHDGNCLLRPDGTAVLVDFELSRFLPDGDTAERERDMSIMQRCIQAIG